MNRGVLATDRTIRIGPDFELAKTHLERIETDQSSDQRISDTKNQFHRFDRLKNSDDTRQHAKNAPLSATRHHARRWRLREHATVARTAQVRREHRRLTIKPENGTVHIRLFGQHADVV